MTIPEQREAIRQKCIKANPNRIHFCCKYGTYDDNEFCDYCLEHARPIRLADILLAIDEKNRVAGMKGWNLITVDAAFKIISLYDLRADDLEQQSEETINFLYKLLNR